MKFRFRLRGQTSIFLFGVLVFWLQTQTCRAAESVQLIGVAPVSFSSVKDLSEDGFTILGDIKTDVKLFGVNIDQISEIVFVTESLERNHTCFGASSTKGSFHSFTLGSDNCTICKYSRVITIELPKTDDSFYVCIRTESSQALLHQGTGPWLSLRTTEKYLLPLWLQIVFVCCLLILSGLFSGLNLGLMALDKTELKVIQRSGNDKEREYASKIEPLRRRGNFLLCTLLLGNVLVNTSLTILLDDIIGSGWQAVVFSTIGIVVFGEIVPQSICSRHGLAIGANTIFLTMIFMVVTAPLSFPISIILDLILGEEFGQVYDRERLKELIQLSEPFNDLQTDEVNIITGALALTKKSAKDIMTPIGDVFMISYDSVLDFDLISQLQTHGYTRVPVYDRTRDNIVSMLNIKDLALIDPDDRIPLKTVIETYQREVAWVEEMDNLQKLLVMFKSGKTHLGFVYRVNRESDLDPFHETLGIVTLEDVIEEIIQSEIIDETDIVTDNRAKKPLQRPGTKSLVETMVSVEEAREVISPQLALAAFQFLSTIVEPFCSEFLNESVLKRLIAQRNIYVTFKYSGPGKPENYLYKKGVSCDYFILVLEGRVDVVSGREELNFHAGPFSYFGVPALGVTSDIRDSPGKDGERRFSGTENHHSAIQPSVSLGVLMHRSTYYPDYTVSALGDLSYLKITRRQYIAARKTTQVELDHMHGGKGSSFCRIMGEKAFTEHWAQASKTDNQLTDHKLPQIGNHDDTVPLLGSPKFSPIMEKLRTRSELRSNSLSDLPTVRSRNASQTSTEAV